MALVANLAVLVYEIMIVSKKKVNPFKQEVYSDLAAHKKILAAHNLLEESEVSESV